MKNIKCVVVGDGAVGKTSLLISYSSNHFMTDYIPTVFDNYTANVVLDGKFYLLNLWDTAGQEEFDTLRYLSYPNTDIFLLCFSLVCRTSFHNIENKWIHELAYYCPNVPYILVGTKCDLCKHSTTRISYDEAINMAKRIDAIKYVETSALTQENLQQVFNEAIKISIFPKNSLKKAKKSKCVIC